MSSPEAENVLSAALRAQAGGGGGAVPPQAPVPGRPPRRRLPVRGVLVFALVLGLAAGAVVAAWTVLPLHLG
ncbi:hypothetical protein IQ251_09755 [Saccharopolyspora sp. HNM0983]|uniref:Uncharacterized protein n=1 Tax=Saccharopolyspora montiporae TaxID=2781240 RepID=A0A929B9M2_9PSEU|nr:hypothetical protein [Saccharopolyspora sp. HNM0983]MBE9374730.1 hypothetical protein [Saccharopolyspora sp. HNM0983]